MRLLRRFYDKLRLVINESKSAVASVFGRQFLGYTLWQGRNAEVRRAVSTKALARISHSHLASLADRAIYRHDRSGAAIIG